MDTSRTTSTQLAMPWLGAALGLTLAIGCGVILTQLLMSPPSSELWDMGAYLTLAGAATMGMGWLGLVASDRLLGLSIQAKTFLTSLIASGVALLNVLIMAQLMFVSTDHDLKLLLALIAFSAVITASFSLLVARTVAFRLRKITAAVRSLAEGDLSSHVSVTGGDEVARLAADVNTLVGRLKRADDQRQALDRERKELTTAISHDLRTPLASLRAMAEALDDSVVEGEEARRYYATMRREIDRLSRMLDDLFLLAQMDSGGLRLTREPLPIEEIVSEVVDALQPHARQYDVSVDLMSAGPATANVDGGRIERAVANLVRNAIEHTPAGGRVAVALSADNGWIAVEVSDTGDGIDPDDMPHIWQRFYRAEKSRRREPRNADGAGLGLAIVRGIVEAHGGMVSAESAQGGSVFAIRLPRG